MTEAKRSKSINRQHFEPDFQNMQMPAEGEIPLVLQGDPQAQFYNTGGTNDQNYLEQAQEQSFIPASDVDNDVEEEEDVEGEFTQEDEYVEAPKQKQTFKEKEDNLRYLREAYERSERERIKAEQRNDEYAKMLIQKNAPVNPLDSIKAVEDEQVDIDIDGDDDSISEKKDVKKVVKGFKVADKKYSRQFQDQQQELKQLKDELSQIKVDTFVRAKYRDFDQIVSKENIDKLNKLHPEVAQTIYETKDYYSKNVAAYSILKQYGMATDPVQQQATDNILGNIGRPKAGVAATPQKRMSPFDNMGRFDKNSETYRMNLIRSMREAQKNR